MSNPTIVLVRNDLRLADNPALLAAARRGAPTIPVYIYSPQEDGEWSFGGATKWWLHQSLTAFSKSLKEIGAELLVLKDESTLDCLEKLLKKTGAEAVYWNRRYEPHSIEIDKSLKTRLKEVDVEVRSFPGNLIFEPWTISTGSGTPYKVYTPYWKACLEAETPAPPLSPPESLKPFEGTLEGLQIEDLELEPKIDWASGMESFWEPGESGAEKRLRQFIDSALFTYKEDRNLPYQDGVSYLSPYLHFGEISPRQIWQQVKEALDKTDSNTKKENARVYLKEIVWREFAHHILYHFPATLEEPLRENFEKFPWESNHKDLYKAWCKGKTGYPIVDAGMRQLWTTGWMHNRVRMIVASFLTKDLLISWQDGAKWFWDTLVDADLASNTFGWQWTAGCGADAAPFFRIFNPVLQGKKFDPDGTYVREWVPELKHAPAKWIHEPWEASTEELERAGITIGVDYPEPVVNHGEARKKALDIYASIK